MHNLNNYTSEPAQRSTEESLGHIHNQYTSQQFNLNLPQNAVPSIGGPIDPMGSTTPATPVGYLPDPMTNGNTPHTLGVCRHASSNQGIPQATDFAYSPAENRHHRDNKIHEDNYKKRKNNLWAELRNVLDSAVGPVEHGKRRSELHCIKLAIGIIK